MTISADASVPIEHTDRIFIGGEWVTPSSGSTITVIDSHTEQAYVTVAEAQPADIDRAVTAHEARQAFDYYADLAATFEWERPVKPGRSGFGLVVKEPVGVVGAIIP